MTCPICARDTAPDWRPFCSRRCADLDLAKWLNGAYAVPSDELEDVDQPDADPVQPPSRPH